VARERVYAQSDTRSVDEVDHPVNLTRRPGVEVTFHRDGACVTLGTGWLTDAPYDEDDAVTRSPAELVETPYHVSLRRADVNLLIRTLRRARNVAWGADE